MAVRFFDIGGIVVHHCLNSLFVNMSQWFKIIVVVGGV